MAEKFTELSDSLQDFIAAQRVFFVATAARAGNVNLSPKGYDTLRILNPHELVWLNLTGSGNETATHLLDCNRMTLMFCAFEGLPQILRLYGTAQVAYPGDDRWQEWLSLFGNPDGARQLFHMQIDLAQTSCGYAVPFMDFVSERDTLKKWTAKKGQAGIQRYWSEQNAVSLDGSPTNFHTGAD